MSISLDGTITTKRIDEEIERAWGIRRTHRKESHDLIVELYEECKKREYEYGSYCAKVVLAVHHLYEAQFETGFEYLLDVVDYFKKSGEPVWYARILNSFGFGYGNMGRFDRAVDYFVEGLSVVRAHKIEEMAVYLICNLAEIYLEPSIGKYEAAYELLSEAEEIEKMDEHQIMPLAEAYMAYSSERMGNWEQALAHIGEAVQIASHCEDLNSVDQCYHFIGETYFNHGEYENAIDITKKSIEKQLSYSEKYGLTSNYFLLAKCYYELKDLENAKEYALKAMENAETLGMESIVGGVAELLAKMYEKEGNYEAVALQLRKVIAQNKKEFTQDLNNHISILSAEQKNISLKKDAEIHRLKNVELKEKSRVLEQTIVELKETQQQLIYQEKMAALGGLIAGIAHEINTPFAVIQAAVQNVNKYVGQVISIDYPELLLRLDPATRASFIRLIKEASKPHELLSTSEERGIRLKLAKELESKGVERAMKVSDWLMDMHIHGVNEDILLVMGSPEKEGIMKVSYELSGIMRNLVNIQRAVTKGSKTVFALKNYTHFGSTKEWTMIDPLDEIKTILQLYEHQIKNKVELAWDAPNPVLVEGMPDELNQVWMNLIHNALQAMSFSGKLRISSNEREDGLEIRITDSGCGIPPEYGDRIFEAFFTTKQQGVGSGLGLHIVKRIIEKHHGSIAFTSQPGETTFTVLLPKRQPKEEAQH